MNYRSEFKRGFTNRGCLHCAVLKAIHVFKEKRGNKSRDIYFFLQNNQNKILKFLETFKKNMKFTRTAY